MKRAAVTIAVVGTIAIGGCSDPVADETKRFDRAFWETWFMHMSDGDRKAVCWDTPEEAARDFAANFDAGYIPAQQRAKRLFETACSELYE